MNITRGQFLVSKITFQANLFIHVKKKKTISLISKVLVKNKNNRVKVRDFKPQFWHDVLPIITG